MPLIIERKDPIGSRLARRASAIPRPKQLVVKGGPLNHASKPSIDPIPITSAKKLVPKVKPPQKPSQIPPKNLDIDPEVPVLELIPFGRQPIVDFGSVAVDQIQIKHICVRNLSEYSQQLMVKSFPKLEKGFNIDSTEFLLAPRTQITVALSWSPTSVGTSRDTITLHDSSRLSYRIVVTGSAVRFKHEPVVRKIDSKRNNLTRFSPKKNGAIPLQSRTHVKLYPSPKKQNLALAHKPLTRLKCGSQLRRQSAQLVTKLLSKYDTISATKVQSYWRMVLAKRQLERLRFMKRSSSASKIQSFFKMIIERKRYALLKRATLAIQSHWRAKEARGELARLKKLNQSIIYMQSYARGLLLRRQLKRQHDAAMRIQSSWRMILAKRHLDQLRHSKRSSSASKIQSFFRMMIERRRYVSLRNAAVTIQSHWRAREARVELSRLHKQNQLIANLQSYARGLLLRRKLKLQQDAAIKIQSFWRMILAKRLAEHMRHLKRRHAASVVQSFLSMVVQRRRYVVMRKATVVLQSYVRSMIARRELSRLRALRDSMIILQSHSRGLLYRSQLRKSIDALNRIQSRSLGQRLYGSRATSMLRYG